MKLLIALLLLVTVSCSKDSSMVGSVAKTAASGISLALQCKQPEKVEARLKEELAKLPIFKQGVASLDEKGLGSMLCAQAVPVVLPLLLGQALNQIPADWECQGDAAKLGIVELAKKACSLITI